MSPRPLDGKVALVTGSTTGIGLETIRRLAADGAGVVVHGLEAEAGEVIAAAFRKAGTPSVASAADIGERAGVAALATDAAALGPPDILVIGASVEVLQFWNEIDEISMAIQTEINLHATVRLIQTFLPPMIERGWGRVVAIGTVQEHRPNDRHFYYAATKAAQTNMILNLARTVRAPWVTFNVVQPGAIWTRRNDATLSDPDRRADIEARIPLGRVGTPADVAGLIAFLCGPDAAYVNGAVLSVDAGLRL
jgi:NAD(P)-dependent dehydrogenase (short-subunit alcohol dehydrogenase family)